MNKNIMEQIEERSELLKKLSKRTTEKLKSFPRGSIYIRHRKNKVYYYLVDDSSGIKEKLLDRNEKEYISALIQRNYLEKVVRAADSELAALERIKKVFPKYVAEDIYYNLAEERKEMINPIVPTDEQFVSRWLERTYDHKYISDDVPVFKTLRGERVRSKSEQIIADRLYLNGIPYKYECPMLVCDNEIIHPDFTILRVSDRKIVYYEHCGRMDDQEYVEDMTVRSIKYSLAGIMQGDRLFYTFETSKTPLDVRVLDNLINSCFR